MSKKKGVSAEEKRTRMLQLFYEKKEFFQLKELEKIAPKEKGIIAQSVKDVVQNLVDDGLVDTDKIGTSIYFWAYPSKAKVSREKRLSEIQEKLDQTLKKIETAKESLEKVKAGKEKTEDRLELLQEVSLLKSKKEELLNEIRKYQDNDPEVLQQLKQETVKSKEAVNRWTDNIFAVKSWCKNKFSIDEATIDKQFGIPTELDYIE